MSSVDAPRTDDDGTPTSTSRPHVVDSAARKPTAGWQDLERALRVVTAAVMDEVKPLGVVGMASFDPLAGFALWREQREHDRDRRHAVRELYPHCVTPDAPSAHDLWRVRVAVKHAIGAYGTASAALGAGDASLREKLASLGTSSSSSNDRAMAHARATEACAKSAGIAREDIIDADWTGSEFSPSAFVAVDAAECLVVLSIRGTWDASDALTDVSSSSVPFLNGWAHAGMVASAWQVLKRMAPAMAMALARHPTFTALVTGHSMGGGVAACVAMLLHSDDNDVKLAASGGLRHIGDDAADARREREEVLRRMASCACVCIAAPSVSSMDLSESASSYITCVVAGADVVPRLCHASVRRLLRRLNAAAPSHAMLKAFSVALGGRDRPVEADVDNLRGGDDDNTNDDNDDDTKRGDTNSTSNLPSSSSSARDGGPGTITSPNKDAVAKRRTCQGAWGELEDVVGLELRDHSAMDFMVQPGRVIHFQHLRSSAPTAEFKHPTAFTDISLDPYMMLDHIPGTYQAAVKTIHERVKAGGNAWVKHADSDDDDDAEDEEREAMSAFVRGEDVRARAEHGWRSLQTFLGIPSDTRDDDDDDDDDRNTAPRHHHHHHQHYAHRAVPSSSSPATLTDDDEEVPNYYGERAELRVAHVAAAARAAAADADADDADAQTQHSASRASAAALAAAWAKRPSWLGGQ